MLIDDLMQYGTKTGVDRPTGRVRESSADRERDRKIRNKCQADLLYYAVLKEMLASYGIKQGRRVQDIETDALCIARDQMAMLASDDGLLAYDKDERVEGFLNPRTGRMDPSFTPESLEHFVRETFRNSEALRAMVSTSLASSPAHRGEELTDEERDALVDREFEERILDASNPRSPLSRVLAIGSSFGNTIGLQEGDADYFAMGIPAERVIRDPADEAAARSMEASLRARRPEQGRFRSLRPGCDPNAQDGSLALKAGTRVMDLSADGTPRTVEGLKLSPLMPEFRTVRVSGAGDMLGLTDSSSREAWVNSLLMYNPQKRLLSRAVRPDQSYQQAYFALSDEDLFTRGWLFGPTEYTEQSYQGVRERSYIADSGGDDYTAGEVVSMGMEPYQGTVFDRALQDRGLRQVYGWKMAEVLRKHSGQQLTEGDYATIRKIMNRQDSGTIFGSVARDGEGEVSANADAYFAYLDNVCGTVRRRMASHEFGIHFREQSHFADKDGFVPLLFFTGERTDDYNKARSNNARYFGIYPFIDYNPANLSVSPLAGDIAPAAYNSYTITSTDHRRSSQDSAMNSAATNRFAHTRRMDRALVAQMDRLFKDYMSAGESGQLDGDVRLAKIRRNVGDTGVDDLSRFILNGGAVNARALTKVLIEDMNRTKGLHREAFLDPANQEHMRNIFEVFAERQGGDAAHIGGAMALMYDKSDAKDPDAFLSELSGELEACMGLELRTAYGQDINSYAAMKHTYKCYLKEFVDTCGRGMARDMDAYQSLGRDGMPDAGFMADAFDNDTYQGLLEGTLQCMADPEDKVLRQSMRDLFGYGENDRGVFTDPDVPQRVVLKGNMLRYSSGQFLHGDYGDLMKLLSYTNAVAYEPDPAKDSDGMFAMLDRGTYVGVQLYADDAFPMHKAQGAPEGAGPAEEPEAAPIEDDETDPYGDLLAALSSDGSDQDDLGEADEDGAADYRSLRDDRAWFDAVFSKPDEGGRSLAWLEMDADSRPSDRDVQDHAVFEATHPLQCAALRKCGTALRRAMAGTDEPFDAERLTISRQGMVGYVRGDGTPVLKIGPVIDEEAYIRPLALESGDGDEVERPVLNEHGFPVRYSNGIAMTETVKVKVFDGIQLDSEGRLENEVVFGPLDRRSTLQGAARENAVNNRYYGVSAKVRPYSGYDHKNNSFTERLEMSTYQMSVLDGVDRCLGLYMAARNTQGEDAGVAASLLYTNVSAVSLDKCYQTNTYLMDSKAKSAVASKFMSNYIKDGAGALDVYPAAMDSADAAEVTERVASWHMAQAGAYRGRVVLPKVSLDQNIGLYNLALNMHQCWREDYMANMDVDSMRNTDSKSARIAMFQDNLMLDDLITGTARSLGAVGYLTDAVRLDRLDGTVEVDPVAKAQEAAGMAPVTRMPFISIGTEDFVTGATRCMVDHPFGQAFDRQQLSTNGNLRALNGAYDMKYAMISLGYNMEDGYIVAKRSAHKLGHFEDADHYKDLSVGDKIGETESGNKGIVSKIVDTDIGAGMPDDEAEKEFLARFLYSHIHEELANYGGPGAPGAHQAFWDSLAADAKRFSNGMDVGLKDWFLSVQAGDAYGDTVGRKLDTVRALSLPKAAKHADNRASADQAREDIYQALKPYLAEMGENLLANRIQPFWSHYQPEKACWQLFRDNPDLEVAMTNVCVCTRSNPSILMNIGEALEDDLARMDGAKAAAEAAGEPFDREAWMAESGSSAVILRNEDGSKRVEPGAAGRFHVYVDSHTADDKNRDYNKNVRSAKAGRRLGAQEFYALQARKCCDAFYGFMTANDPVLPDNIAKLNRKAAMNGFLFDVGTDNLACRRVSDMLEGAALTRTSGPGGAVLESEAVQGIDFTDMAVLARRIAGQVRNGTQDEIGSAVAAMADGLDFSRLLAMKHGRFGDTEAGSKDIEDKLHYMFRSAFGQKGGSMMVLTESMSGVDAKADIGLQHKIFHDGVAEVVPDPVKLSGTVTMPDGHERTAVPLFVSAKEIEDSNAEAEMVTAPVDDRLQFRMFKAALAGAVIDELKNAELVPEGDGHGKVMKLSEEAYASAQMKLKDTLSACYHNIPKEKSLSLDGMNGWTKKNLYYMSMQDSLTCVWRGDPSIGIGEAGISFESAKSLGLLREKAGLTKEELKAIPDTYEFMAERYEPLGEDDLVLVNRSPGQTTGCVRAFRAKVICDKDGGLAINPADATIFDGDFDGDTVGVSKYDAPRRLDKESDEYRLMAEAAKAELKECMSMQGNMVHEAEYAKSFRFPDGSERKDVHPLFIAANADYAVAKHNMSAEGPDGAPACGYDVSRELDAVTAMSNMLYELRNCVHDCRNGADGRITPGNASKVMEARLAQIGRLSAFFAGADGEAPDGKRPDGTAWDDASVDRCLRFWEAGTERDLENTGFWADAFGEFRSVLYGFQKEGALEWHEGVLEDVTRLEGKVFGRLSDVYTDMGGYITAGPKLTHGWTQEEMLHNIVADANITKKGKLPQLNNILSQSSVGMKCEGGSLEVIQNAEKKFELVKGGAPITEFDPSVRMNDLRSETDVPDSPFLSKRESHAVAQSDKADATGLGGAMAQKMQKIFSSAGYGGLGLRISGPITQSYLDAKQNVTKCGNNLKIGKFVLDSVAKFVKFDEFQGEAKDGCIGGANTGQIFAGQYNQSMKPGKGGRPVPEYMTVEECVSQLDNFIQVMGHPGLTEIDRAVATAVMENYATEEKGYDKKVVKDPVKQADRTGDMTFAIMYGGDNSFPYLLDYMAGDTDGCGKGLYDGSFGFDGKIDTRWLRPRSFNRDVAADADRILGCAMGEAMAEAGAPGIPGMDGGEASRLVQERSEAMKEALASVEGGAMKQDEAAKVLAGYGVCDPTRDGNAEREAYEKRRREEEERQQLEEDNLLASFSASVF